MMVTGRGNNKTGWSNEEFDNLLMKAAASPTQQERFSYMYEAEKILIDEMPIIPIYTYTRIYYYQYVKWQFLNWVDIWLNTSYFSILLQHFILCVPFSPLSSSCQT